MDLDGTFEVDELPAPPRQEISPEDLALLQLAAHAIGAQVEVVEGENWVNLHFEDGSTLFHWNSLVHSDDAFNLLVRLRLDLLHGGDAVAINDQHVVLVDYVEYGPDPAADARRAATRAAAEVGKAKL